MILHEAPRLSKAEGQGEQEMSAREKFEETVLSRKGLPPVSKDEIWKETVKELIDKQ